MLALQAQLLAASADKAALQQAKVAHVTLCPRSLGIHKTEAHAESACRSLQREQAHHVEMLRALRRQLAEADVGQREVLALHDHPANVEAQALANHGSAVQRLPSSMSA